MCAFLRYSACGLAALLASAYIAVSAESGMSAFRSTVIEPASTAQTAVNRTNKGDREVTVLSANGPMIGQNKPAMITKEQKILDGCDPAFSPLTASAKNNFTNRCVV
jgi:hypothetical protein